MAKTLDGLLAYLVTIISCAGEHGCTVHELLKAICDSLAPCHPPQAAAHSQPDLAASTVWKWLVDRSDVSVGHQREYNRLSLTEILALPHIRIYISETTMWEVVTGHSVDPKRIPRSEWLLLLGIANSKSHGILQGDLGRLVDQDKRSVPKRTDSLAKKGYICKRTTLVRGTKTSKMWLRAFAPPLPQDYGDVQVPIADLNLPLYLLAENLDPVPWRIRWTGQDIDYTALATTILAVIKDWEVIRIRDLKAKLGVLGMRWQMKTVAKTCRYLNARGTLRRIKCRCWPPLAAKVAARQVVAATGVGAEAGDGSLLPFRQVEDHLQSILRSFCPPIVFEGVDVFPKRSQYWTLLFTRLNLLPKGVQKATTMIGIP
ncbi:TFIIIC transcription initiation factor complex subunits Tfc3 [Ophiocordyceps camponoti-floridani]|uniref:TFIIIC transcription initiation factor complex subunits Tfc3 n=1 Tax=Ophiocordyceps camponoti-floridani TaxID=2030778 RepID=A0A8H4VCB8_9HYPO|nr:TFIIIC transcription initiation factor complex subunits Tfc3 [Ophiocordyceps camponoti-floridani]